MKKVDERDKEFLREWNEVLMSFALEFKKLQEDKNDLSQEEYDMKDKDLAKRIEDACRRIKQKYGRT